MSNLYARVVRPPSSDRAVVFVPADITDPTQFAEVAAPCLERVEVCRYAFVGIVRTWDEVLQMTGDGRAHVVVVASLAQLPADRRPRVETISDPVPPPEPPAGRRSPNELSMPTQRQRRPRFVR